MSNIPFALIVRVVASEFDVAVESVTGLRRHSNTAKARLTACYMARRITSLSFSDIGKRLGGRDHSTILQGVSKIKEDAANDPVFAERLEQIERAIRDEHTIVEARKKHQMINQSFTL